MKQDDPRPETVEVTSTVAIVAYGAAAFSVRLAPEEQQNVQAAPARLLPTLTGALASGNAIALR